MALNDQGFALVAAGALRGGDPGARDARSTACASSGDETTYNYALYNLATAYLGAGRPADAIPLLEERMRFDDGQLGEVGATLDRAYDAAGIEPGKAKKPNARRRTHDSALGARRPLSAPVNRGGRF